MAQVTVNAEPIEITTSDGITVQVGGTTTVTGDVSGTPSGGAGGFLSGTYPNPGVNTEALQDAVGGMAGEGLAYDDTNGDLVVTGSRPIIVAPADGTHTAVTPINGVLPCVLIESSTSGEDDTTRAHIVAPDPADHVGETFWAKVGSPAADAGIRAGATFGYYTDLPAVLGDWATWLASSPPLDHQAAPLTYTFDVNGTPTSVVLDQDYSDATAMLLDILGQLPGVELAPLYWPRCWTADVEPSPSPLDNPFVTSFITTLRGSSASLEVTATPNGDPVGLGSLTSDAGQSDVIMWGVDRTQLMSGHENTHTSPDGGNDPAQSFSIINQGVTFVAIEDDFGAYWGALRQGVRSEDVNVVLSGDHYLVGQVTDLDTAIDLIDQALVAVDDGGGTVDVVSNVTADRILGRVTAGPGDSEELTASQVRTLINVADGAAALSSATPAALGTASAGVATSAARADHVHAAPTTLASVATSSIVGRTTAGTGVSENLTAAQVRALLQTGVTVAGQDDGPTVTATTAATMLDAPFSLSMPNNGDTIQIVASGTTLNNSGSSRTHTWTVEWGNLTLTVAPSALATSATARPWRLLVDVRRESATDVSVSASALVNAVANAIALGTSTTSHANAVTVDLKAQVAAGGSQEIIMQSVAVRYFPAV